MLEIRPNCEHCGKELPNNAEDAMICSFECTFCKECAIEVFKNVCPNCNGNFQGRPIRPQKSLIKFPQSTKRKHNPKNLAEVGRIIEKYKGIKPTKR